MILVITKHNIKSTSLLYLKKTEKIVSVGLDVCCPSLFSKTALPTFMKLYIVLSYVLVRKPIEFGVNWSRLIKVIMTKTRFLLFI